MKYVPTIGLEIHAELKTKTKMFCNSLNDPNEKKPNTNVCPVCMGHPGTLPVINKEAVNKVLMVGKALNGKLAEYSQFDRKNYFYPDLPKGYQISQYKYPLVEGGELKGIKITRIHLEEDAGRLIHQKEGSLVDFNRAGVPLMELVTEPCIKNGEEARKFAEELQLILRYLDASDADMEKGQMRVEVNISISRDYILGTKVEIKNLNSFRSAERAINYEIKRQEELLDAGEEVAHETRGWDEGGQKTFSQRKKEESHDYRYFPEPDLTPLQFPISNFQFPIIELPQQKRERFKKDYNLRDDQIEILINDKQLTDYFESVIIEAKKIVSLKIDIDKTFSEKKFFELIINYLISDLLGLMKDPANQITFDELKIKPNDFAKLIFMIAKDKITSRVAKDVLRTIIEKGGNPEVMIKEGGLDQASDTVSIGDLADKIIKENPEVVKDFKKGKESALQFLIGQAMKLTRGMVKPNDLTDILKQKLK